MPFVEEHRRQTKALELHVYKSCLSSNRKKVAKQIALSQSTVIDIFNCFAKTKIDHNRGLLTRVLGIDEISLKKRHKQFALVISDIDKKCILAVLPDRKKETLIEWLSGLTNQQRKAIKYQQFPITAGMPKRMTECFIFNLRQGRIFFNQHTQCP